MNPIDYRCPDLLIGGQWRSGRHEQRQPVRNPATGELLGELHLASDDDLQEALSATHKAFEHWRRVPAHERCVKLERGIARMREQTERIAHLLTLEQGKPLAEARTECAMAADLIKWYAEEARRVYGRVIPARLPNSRMEVFKAPVGPVAAMVECLAQELPEGVLQLVYGIPAEVSQTLIASPIIRKVTFTGSVPVGRHLAELAARQLKRITLELGGHAPVIVCADADIGRAVNLVVQHKYRNAGQACLAPTRFFVHRSIQGAFIEAFSHALQQLRVGNGLDPQTQVGPVANLRRQAAVTDLIERTQAAGARIVRGQAPQQGAFVAPTLLVDVPERSPVMVEEPFGPVAAVLPFETLDEAIARANGNAYGLAGYLFTDSAKAILQVSENLEVGTLAVNGMGVSVSEAPFGGVKDSGYGSESGIEGMGAFLDTKFMHYVS